MLDWLAKRQVENKPDPYRRMSRHEFVHSLNDLLGVKLDLTGEFQMIEALSISILTEGLS